MITIPLWYGLCLSVGGAYLGFWYGRSRNWGMLEMLQEQNVKKREKGGSELEGSLCEKNGTFLASPCGGRAEEYHEGEQSGFRILTTESELYAPAFGRIIRISPRGNAFWIRTDWGGDVQVRACTNEDDLLDRYFRPRVVKGQVVRRGTLLLEYDREALCRKCEDTAVYLLVEEQKYQEMQCGEADMASKGEWLLRL